MTFRFIEVDEIIENEIKAMDKKISPGTFDKSLETIQKLTDIQSKMYSNQLKGKHDEFEREKDLRDFEFKKEESEERKRKEDREFELRKAESEAKRRLEEREFYAKQEQTDKEFELRMKELDIRLEQLELERLKSDREFELRMRELDEKAKEKRINWYDFAMDIMDKFGVAGLMAMVLHYEKLEAVTTKAWQIILKCIHLRH